MADGGNARSPSWQWPHLWVEGGRKSGGMKRWILRFRLPPGHRDTIIALQNSTECCLEFTAAATIECVMGCVGRGGGTWGGGGGGEMSRRGLLDT